MNDTTQTTLASFLATISTFFMVHISEFQAFITFILTCIFLFYKIREAKAKANKAVKDEQSNRH